MIQKLKEHYQKFLNEFKGSYFIFSILFVVGIFIPPFIPISLVYLNIKRYHEEIKFFDINYKIYIFSLALQIFLLNLMNKDMFSKIIPILILGVIIGTIIYIPAYIIFKKDYHEYKLTKSKHKIKIKLK